MKDEILGAITAEGNRRTLRFERAYATGGDDLWAAITEPERLARWFARVGGNLRTGGTYEVVFDEDDPSQRAWGTVLECDPPHHLAVSWIFGDDQKSVLVVDLLEDGDRTRLELVHRALPRGATAGYGAGWHTYLDQLDAHLAGRDAGGAGWDASWKALLPHYEARLP